jgi:cardiolipin synthase (CMP-forming)
VIRALRHAPNVLTAMRLGCAPLLAYLLTVGDNKAALTVFVFAGLSDAADGYLAKRFGLATPFGRYLDPAADKLLMLFAFLALTWLDVTPVWLTAIVIARDVAIVFGIFLAKLLVLPLSVEPLAIGKFNTGVQIGYVALMLLLLAGHADWPRMSDGCAVATGAITIASWMAYGQVWFAALARRRRTA